MDDEQRQPTPVFELPTKQEQYKADPYAEQRAYFQYWEAKELERRTQARRRRSGLSVYERAREKNSNSY